MSSKGVPQARSEGEVMFHRHKWEAIAQTHLNLPSPIMDATDELTQTLYRCPCGEVEERFRRGWHDTLARTAVESTT